MFFFSVRKKKTFKLSSVQNPGWLFLYNRGFYYPVKYKDYNRICYKDSVINQPGFNGMSLVGFVSWLQKTPHGFALESDHPCNICGWWKIRKPSEIYKKYFRKWYITPYQLFQLLDFSTTMKTVCHIIGRFRWFFVNPKNHCTFPKKCLTLFFGVKFWWPISQPWLLGWLCKLLEVCISFKLGGHALGGSDGFPHEFSQKRVAGSWPEKMPANSVHKFAHGNRVGTWANGAAVYDKIHPVSTHVCLRRPRKPSCLGMPG